MTEFNTAPRPAASARHIALLVGVAAVLLAADQLIKQLVVDHMAEGQRIEVLGEILQIHFVRNPGAAFSIASGMTWIFTIIAAVVVAVIVINARRIRSVWWAIVLGLVLGGTLGNLGDRLFRAPGTFEGHVVDYISTPWIVPAIYNLADIAIVGGMIMVALLTILDIGFDGERGAAKAKAAATRANSAEESHETDTNSATA